MKIVFFGSPNFALPSLKLLNDSKHEIIHIVTSPDSKSGRGLKINETPVSKLAKQLGIPCSKPATLDDAAIINTLIDLNADIFIVIAFRILPQRIYSIPIHGSINLHASLLPKYRGAAPIEHAILNGDKITGVTSFKIDEKVDTGKLLLSEKYTIGDNNFGQVYKDLSQLGSKLMLDTINGICSNSIIPVPQTGNYTKAPKIINSMHCRIDFDKSADFIFNQIRAFSPNRGAFTFIANKRVKIFKASISNMDLKQGQVYIDDVNFIIGCNDKSINILVLQVEGKQLLDIDLFLKGNVFKDVDFIDE